MKRKAIVQLAAMAAMITGVLSGPQVVNAADAGTHVFYVTGISVISQGECEYEWKRDSMGQPIRDDLGIPQPASLPPKCRDTNASQPGIQPKGCNLKRNLGPAAPYWRAADLTKGEVGLNAPCSGVLTASLLPGTQGCTDLEADTNVGCDLDAPTWFYGYCGQTYGGDTATDGVGAAATMTINGKLWKFDKLGFARGRGAWEFGARIFHPSTATWATASSRASARFYLTAVPNPNEPANAAGCDGGPAVKSVQFQGTITTPAPPVKVFRTKRGWHPCADDPIVDPATIDGC